MRRDAELNLVLDALDEDPESSGRDEEGEGRTVAVHETVEEDDGPGDGLSVVQ